MRIALSTQEMARDALNAPQAITPTMKASALQ